MTAANNSLIAYPNTVKPAYYAVKEACRPKLYSLRIEKFGHTAGEEVFVTPYVINDTGDCICENTVGIFIEYNGKREQVGEFTHGKAEAYENFAGSRMHFTLPEVEGNAFTVTIGEGEMASAYRLLSVK